MLYGSTLKKKASAHRKPCGGNVTSSKNVSYSQKINYLLPASLTLSLYHRCVMLSYLSICLTMYHVRARRPYVQLHDAFTVRRNARSYFSFCVLSASLYLYIVYCTSQAPTIAVCPIFPESS